MYKSASKGRLFVSIRVTDIKVLTPRRYECFAIHIMNTQRFPELYRPMVDEAPHLRERSVPMKVLVLGFPRTGTSCKSLSSIAKETII